jgi:hypothetical protein
MYADRETLVTEICARISTGEPLAQICRDVHMPDRTVVYDWINQDESISQRFAHARSLGFDAIADECLVISNTPQVGVEEKVTPAVRNQQGDVVVPESIELKRGDMLGHRKLQIETRLKLLAKWDPKRYGEKQQVEHSGTIDSATTIIESRKRSGRS